MPPTPKPWFFGNLDYYGERQLEALLQARLSDPDPRTREDARFALVALLERRERRRSIHWIRHSWVMALGLGGAVLIGLLLD